MDHEGVLVKIKLIYIWEGHWKELGGYVIYVLSTKTQVLIRLHRAACVRGLRITYQQPSLMTLFES